MANNYKNQQVANDQSGRTELRSISLWRFARLRAPLPVKHFNVNGNVKTLQFQYPSLRLHISKSHQINVYLFTGTEEADGAEKAGTFAALRPLISACFDRTSEVRLHE